MTTSFTARVEVAARAAHESRIHERGVYAKPWPELPAHRRLAYLIEQRAALMALDRYDAELMTNDCRNIA